MRAPSVVVEPGNGVFHLDLSALWKYRELIFFLVWRDVKVRYKQTVVGAGWVILQPLSTMMIFTLIFSYLVKIPSDGLPYPIFAYTALLPWNYFSGYGPRRTLWWVTQASSSKVYFPRLIIPLASVVTPLVDFLLSFVLLVGLMVWYGSHRPGVRSLCLSFSCWP
jgi:lipopolysaccharide transport system permease protein